MGRECMETPRDSGVDGRYGGLKRCGRQWTGRGLGPRLEVSNALIRYNPGNGAPLQILGGSMTKPGLCLTKHSIGGLGADDSETECAPIPAAEV